MLLAPHEHAQPLGLIGARIAGKCPVGILRRLVANPQVCVAALPPVVQGEERLAGVVVMDLHRAVTVQRVGRLIPEVEDLGGGVRHIGAVRRAIVVRPELDIAPVRPVRVTIPFTLE